MAVPEGLMLKLNEIKETLVQNNVVYSQNLPTIYPDTPIQDLSNVLAQDDDFFRNCFFPELIKRIVKVQVENVSYTNPLRYLKGAEMPLGGISQHIYINRVSGRQFNCEDFAGLLAHYKADIKVVYNAINWDYQYPLTITYDNARDAFTSWDKLYNFVDQLAQSLTNSAEIDDFNLTKRMMTNAYLNNQVPMIEVTEPTDEASARALVRQLRTLYKKMQFASTQYNGWSLNGGYGNPATTWTRPEDIIVFISAEVEALLDVDVLARAFNLNSTDLMGRVFTVDDFSIYDKETGELQLDGSNIVAMIGDRKWFSIENNMRKFNQFFNANNETWQLYLHVRESFNSLPFANMVALVTETPTIPVTGLNYNNTEEITLLAGESEGLDINVTPVQATTKITYAITKDGEASEDIEMKVSADTRNVILTAKANATGEYVLTASADQVSTTININVPEAVQAASVQSRSAKTTDTKSSANAKNTTDTKTNTSNK